MTVHKRNTSEAWNDDDWTGDSSTTSPSDDDAIRLDDTAFDTPEPGDELDDEWGSDGEDSFGTGDYELEERYALRRWPGSRPSSRTSPRSSTGNSGSSGWCSPASGPKAPSRTPTTPWPSSSCSPRPQGLRCSKALSQRRRKPDPATYIGPGKVDYLRAVVAETGADTVICDGELSPAQLRNLEDRVKVKVVDRTALILDIFAQHARSKEGKTQVELAQLDYLKQRLRGWGGNLSRQAGGRVGVQGGGIGGRGPGETKLVRPTPYHDPDGQAAA